MKAQGLDKIIETPDSAVQQPYSEFSVELNNLAKCNIQITGAAFKKIKVKMCHNMQCHYK